MSTTYPEITILYEDEGCIVVAKPPQLLTHGHPRFPHEISLIERIQEQCRRSLYIVHRLDRGASGCLLISKDPTRVQSYKDQLHDGQKTYIALSRGVYRGESPIVVTNPMKVKEIHKEAESYVQCLERIVNPRSSLFLVRPKTGRYHQVRRHLRDLTHPILGDSEHGDSKVNRWWRENMGLKRLALHAYSIRFSDRFVCCPIFLDQQDLFMRISIDNIQDYLN